VRGSPRVYVYVNERYCFVVCTLKFVLLPIFISPPSIFPSIRHFFFILCILVYLSHFSHQKLIPYGYDPTFEFTHDLFLSGYLLLATYHLPFLLPPPTTTTTTTTYRILLTIRRLRPDTRVIIY
jgi:hypothetical protein